MKPWAAQKTAGILFFVGLALTLVAAVLHVLTRDVPVEHFGIRGFQGAFGLVIGATGWLILSKHARNAIGWIFITAGLASCLQAFDSAYGTYSFARHGGTLPGTDIFVWLGTWIWVLIIGPMSTLVPLLFPSGAPETRRQRDLLWFSSAAIVVFAAVTAVAPGQAGELPLGVTNPYAISAQASERLAPLMMLFLVAVVLSFATLVRRFRRSTGEVRQQMKLLTFAVTLATITIIAGVTLFANAVSSDDPAPRFAAVAIIVSFLAIPIAAGIAIVRYGLYEIDIIINKTIVYGLLAVFITVVYVGVVVGVGTLIGTGANTGLSVAATAVVAVAIQPVRARATHLANRIVFGKRANPYEALSEFSARLSEQTDDVLPRLARLMTEATAATRASVWLAVGDSLRPVATWPTAPVEQVPLTDDVDAIDGWDRVYPVRHEREVLGALAVSVPPAEQLKPTEERLLSDLGSQTGLVLRNARLIEELRASRQRLVAAQDSERQKIERNLHDGAQQQLVALKVKLSLLSRMIDGAPPTAREMVDQLSADATDALDNLRDLAHGIYPPVLADRGLVAALQTQAAKAPMPVAVEGDRVGRYPEEAEAAVYFCVLEALQNASKYAGAGSVTVMVTETPGRLGFEVRDDGRGFDVARARRGAGLTNMADRLDALGGRLEVTSAPGAGATIAGWVAAAPR